MTIRLYDLVGKDRTRPFSPHCWKVAFALAHKGLDFESVPTSFTEIPQVESGFSKTVPVIRDGETVVAESLAIALYLEETYPNRPSLFLGEGGKAMARFIERWSQSMLAPLLSSMLLMDIHELLDDDDKAYFRATREARFGNRLEDITLGREGRLETLARCLEPVRATLTVQPFLGGDRALFCDYVVAGMLQWARVASPFRVLQDGDPVGRWFETCLSLHGGLGARVKAA